MDGNKMKFKTRTQKNIHFPGPYTQMKQLYLFKIKSTRMSVNNVVDTCTAAEATPIKGCR